MLQIRCIRCGGPHLVWECPTDAGQTEALPRAKTQAHEPPVRDGSEALPASARFDKVAYMRAYMKKRRAQARREGKRID